jgi:predicted Zn-dependent protease
LVVNRIETAATAFKEVANRAVQMNSTDWLVRNAVWQVRAGDVSGARNFLQKALAADDQNVRVHVALFKLEMAANRIEPAIARAAKIASLDNRSPVGKMLMGDAYMRLRKFDSALTSYEAALIIDQSSDLAARVYQALRGARRDAMGFARNWSQERPNDSKAQRLLAKAYDDTAQETEAATIYENLLKESPNDTALLVNLAFYFVKQDESRARGYAERAYKLAPTDPVVLDAYGWVMVQDGDEDEGLTLLRNAALRAPGDPQIHYHLAVALNKVGKKKEAQQALRAALQSGQYFEADDVARRLLSKLNASQ